MAPKPPSKFSQVKNYDEGYKTSSTYKNLSKSDKNLYTKRMNELKAIAKADSSSAQKVTTKSSTKNKSNAEGHKIAAKTRGAKKRKFGSAAADDDEDSDDDDDEIRGGAETAKAAKKSRRDSLGASGLMKSIETDHANKAPTLSSPPPTDPNVAALALGSTGSAYLQASSPVPPLGTGTTVGASTLTGAGGEKPKIPGLAGAGSLVSPQTQPKTPSKTPTESPAAYKLRQEREQYERLSEEWKGTIANAKELRATAQANQVQAELVVQALQAGEACGPVLLTTIKENIVSMSARLDQGVEVSAELARFKVIANRVEASVSPEKASTQSVAQTAPVTDAEQVGGEPENGSEVDNDWMNSFKPPDA